MQYNSWLYLLVFLGLTVSCYYLTPLKNRWIVLLCASIVFYFVSCGWLILVLPLTTLALFWFALRIERKETEYQAKKKDFSREERKTLKEQTQKNKTRLLAAACILAFGILFFTKYFNFVGSNLNALFSSLSLSAKIPTLRLLMPLGISFYTLSAISYVADVAHGACPAQKNYGKLLLFLMFFPVITEGPISRYGQLGPQLEEGHRFDYQSFCFGMQLILWGLFQKVVLADRINIAVSEIFIDYQKYSGGVTVAAILLYTFQIYMDFAGCVDIARGSAKLFGIQLAENFRRPFFANTVNDFWRRWHITLGSWLRDYIFYPLSMSHGFQTLSRHSRKYLNAYYAATLPALIALLGVWLGNGIWHGAAWKYIIYGLYYYAITALGMLLEPVFLKVIATLHLKRESRGYRLFQIIRTFILVNIGMLIFRAKNLQIAWHMLRSIFRPDPESVVVDLLTAQELPPSLFTGEAAIFIVGVIIVFIVSVAKERGVCISQWIAERPLPIRWAIYLAAVLAVVVTGAYGPGFGAVDFIYAQF